MVEPPAFPTELEASTAPEATTTSVAITEPPEEPKNVALGTFMVVLLLLGTTLMFMLRHIIKLAIRASDLNDENSRLTRALTELRSQPPAPKKPRAKKTPTPVEPTTKKSIYDWLK